MSLDLQSYYLLGGGGSGGSSDITLKKLKVSRNGTYKAGAGKGYSEVDVDVYSPEQETLNVTENGTYTPEEGYAYTSVNVGVPLTTVQSLSVVSDGTYTAPSGHAYSPVTVNTGGRSVSVDDEVRFFGYGGELVYTYSAQEFAELSSMPANPAHEGMIAQGWNWDLADAKAYVAKYGMLDIGQDYITDDEKTRIYITIPDDIKPEYRIVNILWKQYYANGVEIDWGDGSSPETSEYTGNVKIQKEHTYTNAGSYVITLNVLIGSVLFIGDYYGASDAFLTIFGDESKPNSIARNWCTKIEFGSGVESIYYALARCGALKTITVPKSTNFGMFSSIIQCPAIKHITVPGGCQSFDLEYAYGLGSVSFPQTLTSLGAMTGCSRLYRATIPDGVTQIPSRAFYECTSLRTVVIPDTVTSIGDSAFQHCSNLESITIPDSIETLGTGVFNACSSLSGSITIPSGADLGSALSSYGFYMCYGITNIYHNTNSSPKKYFYYGLHSLVTITISAGVASIPEDAFGELYSIREMHFLSTTPPSLQAGGLSHLPSDCIIYVPAESVDAYKTTTYWSSYASKIQAEPSQS